MHAPPAPNEGCLIATNMAEPAHPPALEQICGTECIIDYMANINTIVSDLGSECTAGHLKELDRRVVRQSEITDCAKAILNEDRAHGRLFSRFGQIQAICCHSIPKFKTS